MITKYTCALFMACSMICGYTFAQTVGNGPCGCHCEASCTCGCADGHPCTCGQGGMTKDASQAQ